LWKCGNLHKATDFFLILERIARSCVDEPKCPISHFVDTNEIPFLPLQNHAE
jgi:hypothetical protein